MSLGKLSTPRYTIARYLNVRNAYAPAFSVDGERIFFLTDITGVAELWQVDLAQGGNQILWPEQLTFEGERVMGVWPSPNLADGRIVYARDVGGDENAQLFLLSTDSGFEIQLTRGYEDVLHIFGAWSSDGSSFLFAANRREKGLFDLYEQPLDGEARLVWRNDKPGFLFNICFSPDSGRVAMAHMASSFNHDLLEVDLASGAARQLSPVGEEVRYADLSYTPDGAGLFVNTDLGSDFQYIGRLDLQDLSLEPLLTPQADVEKMTLSSDGRWLAYAINEDGASSLHLYDTQRGETRRGPALGGTPGVVAWWDEVIRFSPDGGRLTFSYTNATRTRDVYVWELENDRVQVVTRASHGGLPLDSFIGPELVHYPTFDHDSDGDPLQIPAWFYKPAGAGEGPLRVIVMVHGGPEAQFKPFFHFLVQYLLQCGYAVLAPNVRGSTGYGKTYSHLDDVEKRLDSVRDLAHAAYWLKEQPDIDSKSLVVYGGSYGGFMVLAALTNYPELWAAGINIVGISNFVTFLENTSHYRRAHREAEYGSLERDRAFLESISPLNQVERIRVPLMVIHGANDPRVPLGEAEQLVEALRGQAVPVEFLVFDDEGHGLVRLKNKLVAYPAIVKFLDNYLPPG